VPTERVTLKREARDLHKSGVCERAFGSTEERRRSRHINVA
jgi:hypothetical protein